MFKEHNTNYILLITCIKEAGDAPPGQFTALKTVSALNIIFTITKAKNLRGDICQNIFLIDDKCDINQHLSGIMIFSYIFR